MKKIIYLILGLITLLSCNKIQEPQETKSNTNEIIKYCNGYSYFEYNGNKLLSRYYTTTLK